MSEDTAEKVLDAPPALLPLYARAMLAGKASRGDALPDTTYRLDEQAVDREHLARYERICGFAVQDELPPTYLHVLAFPLAVALMSEPGFPLPLVGLIHVTNAITVTRPVRAEERPALRVHAADLRPHPVGQQFDVLTEARVAGEPVWRERSTYLRRLAPSGERREHAELGEQRGALARVRVPEDVGRKYAAISGDRNPIHLHALAAKAFGFPTAIGHGMWLAARTVATLQGRLPTAFTLDVAFKTPVPLPSTVAIAAERDGDGWALDVRGARSGKPHLAGSLVAR